MSSPLARLRSFAPGREPLDAPEPDRFPRTLRPVPDPETGPVTDLLYARLTPQDVDAVQAALPAEHRHFWDQSSSEARKRLALALGLYYGVEGVADRTGLVSAEPPATVHSMVRGLVGETGGSFALADMIVEFLEEISCPLAPGSQALDFSCSSGRVVRPLAAALPEISWSGCDPNAGAIQWARENLRGIEFFVSEINPPLPFADGQLQLAFAISVWSHFSSAAALRWLEEMGRIVGSGGHLLLTTHGLNSCAWFGDLRDAAIDAKLGPHWIPETADRLEVDGHCFWNVFEDRGDWGVVDADWGLSFFTPEWLLAHVTPTWSIRTYRIGRAHGNQDVYLLQRS